MWLHPAPRPCRLFSSGTRAPEFLPAAGTLALFTEVKLFLVFFFFFFRLFFFFFLPPEPPAFLPSLRAGSRREGERGGRAPARGSRVPSGSPSVRCRRSVGGKWRLAEGAGSVAAAGEAGKTPHAAQPGPAPEPGDTSLSSQLGNPPRPDAAAAPCRSPPPLRGRLPGSPPLRARARQRLRRLGRHAPWARVRPRCGAARLCTPPGTERSSLPASFSSQAAACVVISGVGFHFAPPRTHIPISRL